nr:pantoate--beta-alanine ligase [Angustibacter aerolatus]
MTMGALHEGHRELIRQAAQRARHVVVTIFLNPLQFGPGEDLSRYPRTVDDDVELCAREGVDVVFTPTPDVVYPDGDPGVRVSAGPLGDVLEGRSRPGHFDGVLTVVGKAHPPDAAARRLLRAEGRAAGCCSSGAWCGTSTSASRSSRCPRCARTTGWR